MPLSCWLKGAVLIEKEDEKSERNCHCSSPQGQQEQLIYSTGGWLPSERKIVTPDRGESRVCTTPQHRMSRNTEKTEGMYLNILLKLSPKVLGSYL